MDWFSIHTSWLYKETKDLSNNTIYKENYQFIDNTLVSSGNILVHKEITTRYPILIVYPEATPYVPPIIYMLDHDLEEEDIKEYSTLPPEEIKGKVRNNVTFFQRRHQNDDGSICFIETGDLHSENAEIFSIRDIIKRLRIWLSGKIPKDSREVELFNHFTNRANDIQYLLPDLFFDKEIVKGKFYAGLSNYLLANTVDGVVKTYIGTLIEGENKAGVVCIPKIYVKEQLVLFTKMPDTKDLILNENTDKKHEAINKGQLIEGYWWDILAEPEPFSTVQKLAKYIGNSSEEDGLEELIKALKEPLGIPSSRLQEMIHIGIRFPGRWRENDWQIFRLTKGNRPHVLVTDTEEVRNELKERLLDYSIEAVKQEYFTDQYFHMRNAGRAERSILKNKLVSIIGCGALGSETADALTKAGIGKMILVDKELMKAHNAIRHCLGIDKVSLPKVLGMAENLFFHNPFTDIDANSLKQLDVLKSNLTDFLPEEAIGVSTIADDNIEAFLNEKAVNENRIIFYCRALRGGKAARIFRVIPQQDACKRCLALYLYENDPSFIDIDEDPTLPVITNECNNPVRPASAADLKIVSGIFSRIIVDYLQGNNDDKNHWIWSTESLKNIKLDNESDGLIHTSLIAPHPNCPTCQKLEDKKVLINNEAYVFLKNEATHSKDIETGGVLIGYRSEKGEYIISKVTGPGPKAIRTKTVFEKDEEYCQKELESAFKELKDKGLYIGEWHYHATNSNQPSGIDIKSLTEIATQKEYRIDKPIMIIISQALECAITIHDKNGRCIQIPMERIYF